MKPEVKLYLQKLIEDCDDHYFGRCPNCGTFTCEYEEMWDGEEETQFFSCTNADCEWQGGREGKFLEIIEMLLNEVNT